MRYILLTFLLLGSLLSVSVHQTIGSVLAPEATADIPETPKEPNNSTEPVEPEVDSANQSSSLIDFYAWSAVLPKDLLNLKSALASKDYNILKQEGFPEIAADIRDLQWKLISARSEPYIQKLQFDSYSKKYTNLQNNLEKMSASLTNAVKHLSNWDNEWNQNATRLEKFSAQKNLSMALAIDKKGELLAIVNEAKSLLDMHLQPALVLGKELVILQMHLQTINEDLLHFQQEIVSSRLQRSTDTLLSGNFYKKINVELIKATYQGIQQILVKHYHFLIENKRIVFIALAIFLSLSGIISFSKNLIVASSRWYPFASAPFATSIFILTSSFGILQRRILLLNETQWNEFLNILTILAVIQLVKSNINTRWKQFVLIRIALFMAILMLFATFKLPESLMLLFVVITSTAALSTYFFNLKKLRQSNLLHFTLKAWGLLPAIIILAALTGYNLFSIFLFTTVISGIGICLTIWMLFHLNSGLIELLLTIGPFSLIRDNVSIIVKSLQPFLAIFHVVFCVALISVNLNIYNSLEASIQSISNFGFNIAGIHISPGFLLTIFIVLNGALLFSRAIQAILLKEILPRYTPAKGVQISITRLVHYAILTIGFFVMLNFLGFELKQLTILGGALGVGIGFGLQAIVNNFVSGLILLFERPIKVGDTIQINTEFGEVKNVGLRATIIQTFDNAEIVVPNADLITGQVTNWTLAERKVRVRLAVGVAYGSDVAKVLEILRSCALSHPMVLSTPKPTALFLAFGNSSLDFELRFWIPEFLDKMDATSELNQSIETEFAINNIEIPFPQTDLHIRSVDSSAAMAFRGQPPEKQPLQSEVEKNEDMQNETDGSHDTAMKSTEATTEKQ